MKFIGSRIVAFNNNGSVLWNYEYNLKDHLGNTRVVFTAHADGNPEVNQVTSYDPFGFVTTQNNWYPTGAFKNKFLYNGKELNDDQLAGTKLDWYDYGARMYDAQLGRWHSVDPACEDAGQESWSQYHYVFNNPIKNTDPDGQIPLETIWDIGNVIYDVGAALVNHIKGDHKAARSNWADFGMDAGAMLIPYVPAGASKLIKAGDKAVDAAKAADKGADAMKNRVKLQKDTKEAIKDAAPKTKDGTFIDPNTGKPIEKGQEVYGHKKGEEWSKYKKDPANQDKSRKEVIKDQNDPNKYQIEDKKSNASHKYEEKKK